MHVRLSEDEFLALQSFSIAAGSSVSDVLRQLLEQACDVETVWGTQASSILTSYVSEIRRVGGDLNEIVHALQGRKEPRFDALIDGISRLARLVSDHGVEIQAVCEGLSGRARETVSGDV